MAKMAASSLQPCGGNFNLLVVIADHLSCFLGVYNFLIRYPFLFHHLCHQMEMTNISSLCWYVEVIIAVLWRELIFSKAL